MHTQIKDTIIKTLGIDALPPQEQEEMYAQLGAIVYMETLTRAVDMLSEEDKVIFEKIINDNPDPEIMFTFLSEKIPGIDEIVKQESEKMKDEVSTLMNNIG